MVQILEKYLDDHLDGGVSYGMSGEDILKLVEDAGMHPPNYDVLNSEAGYCDGVNFYWDREYFKK